MNSSDLSNEVKLRMIQIPFELSVLPVCLETRRSALRILLGLRTLQQELPDNDERFVKSLKPRAESKAMRLTWKVGVGMANAI